MDEHRLHVIADGSDTLSLLDQVATTPQNYRLTAGYLDRDTMRQITYATVESLTLTAGNQSDTITVESTASGVATTLNAGQGNDTITVGSKANSLDPIRGPLTIRGDAHMTQDVLTLNDQGNTRAQTYVITPTTVTRGGFLLVTYATVERLVLNPSHVWGTLIGTTGPIAVPRAFGPGSAPGGTPGPGGGDRPEWADGMYPTDADIVRVLVRLLSPDGGTT